MVPSVLCLTSHISMFSLKIFSQGGEQIVSATDRPSGKCLLSLLKALTYFATTSALKMKSYLTLNYYFQPKKKEKGP